MTLQCMKPPPGKLEADGYVIVPGVLSTDERHAVEYSLSAIAACGAGTRNLLAFQWCRMLAARIAAHGVIQTALQTCAVAVQCTLFDKSPDRNWLVALHQDVSIPVRNRVEHPALRGWSQKEGQYFVQPPVTLLQSLLAVRVHIDDCGPSNGPLRVVPGSHRRGRLHSREAELLRDTTGNMVCAISAGDALLMRPLLLHASSKAAYPARRRVLHFLFGPASPGYGLEWPDVVQSARPSDGPRLGASSG